MRSSAAGGDRRPAAAGGSWPTSGRRTACPRRPSAAGSPVSQRALPEPRSARDVPPLPRDGRRALPPVARGRRGGGGLLRGRHDQRLPPVRGAPKGSSAACSRGPCPTGLRSDDAAFCSTAAAFCRDCPPVHMHPWAPTPTPSSQGSRTTPGRCSTPAGLSRCAARFGSALALSCPRFERASGSGGLPSAAWPASRWPGREGGRRGTLSLEWPGAGASSRDGPAGDSPCRRGRCRRCRSTDGRG
jgi:hypothetical protein